MKLAKPDRDLIESSNGIKKKNYSTDILNLRYHSLKSRNQSSLKLSFLWTAAASTTINITLWQQEKKNLKDNYSLNFIHLLINVVFFSLLRLFISYRFSTSFFLLFIVLFCLVLRLFFVLHEMWYVSVARIREKKTTRMSFIEI